MFSIRQTGNQIGAITASLLLPAIAPALGWMGSLLVVAGLCLAGAGLLAALRGRFPVSDAPVAGHRPSTRESLQLVWSTPGVRAISIAAFAFSTMQICLNGYMTTYATMDLGMTLATAGILLAVAQIGGLVARIGMGFAVEWAGAARPVLLALGLLMTVSAVAVASFTLGWGWPGMLVAAALFGVSASGWNGIFYAEVARLAPDGRAAEATGGAQFVAFAGLITGPLLFGLVAKLTGTLAAGYLTLAVLTLLGSALLLKRSADWQ
jgi:predicted MFS family arabinose efflux permease